MMDKWHVPGEPAVTVRPDPPPHEPDGRGADKGAPDLSGVPLTPDAWARRKLDPPNFLMGQLLSTTSRVLFSADTGLGKSMFALAVAFALCLGRDFLHWKVTRPARVLVLDGEMPRDLLQERIRLACGWFGVDPGEITDGLFILSREDVEDMPALDSENGHAWLAGVVDRLGGVDFAVLDNCMSLTVGDLREETTWRGLVPLSRELSRRKVGQLWLHHVGHDKTRSYGSRTFAWQMDTEILGEAVARDGADVSVRILFKKNRRRSPANRLDYADTHVLLENGRWSGTPDKAEGAGGQRKGTLTGVGKIALKALDKAIAANGTAPPTHYATVGVKNAVQLKTWRTYYQQIAGYGDDPKDKEAEKKAWNRGRENVQATGLATVWSEWAWKP